MSQRSRARVYETLRDLFPELVPALAAAKPCPQPGQASSVGLRRLTPRMQDRVVELLASERFDAFTEALVRVGNCSHPVRLVGSSLRVDTSTGEVLSEYASRVEPLGVTYVRCGNRRAEVCPSCSRLYAGDMFHLIRAGVVGGKTVPDTVSDNPLVFATLTAPSFGPVHGHRDRDRRCHPVVQGPGLCRHGRQRVCTRRHGDDDPLLGQPLCEDC